MTFTHPPSPPESNLTDIYYALWLARARSGDTRQRGGRVDEDWFFDLQTSAAIVTQVPNDEAMKPLPVAIGQRMYRPFFAAAAHIRAIIYKLRSAGQSNFADLSEAADALETRQLGLDIQYGLRTSVNSDSKSAPSVDLERV